MTDHPTMTRPLSATDVAKMLGRSRTWFNQNKKRLRQAGFPKRDQLLGGWDEAAVIRWARDHGEVLG